MSFGPKPWQQTSWDWRAAGNFIGGGAGTGLIVTTALSGAQGTAAAVLLLAGLALVGLGAQLVDGSLGMAYGVTSTTLLLAIATNPAAASATVHLAEIGTTLASGAAHWRFGNVDWRVVAKIGIPGAVGAFAGATLLASLSTDVAAPMMSLILLALGIAALFGRLWRSDIIHHPR